MEYRVNQLRYICSNAKWNLYTAFFTAFHKRNKKVWIFGAWMGEKFADNSRFLFQYLHENKKKYNILDVIWATRNPEVFSMLKNMGYHVVLMGTEESKKAHLLAGVHVICNSDGNNGGIGDIDTKFSFGAKKIQLWHGVGIKAVGRLKNGAKVNILRALVHEKIISNLSTPGYWRKCYFLTTSAEGERVIHSDNNIAHSHIFRGTYPRLCPCPALMENEKIVIDKILNLKNKNFKIVLYLPTFRKDKNKYVMPREIPNFDKFLELNNIYWIEKKHSADVNTDDFKNGSNIIGLGNDFDINILYKYIDLLVTDYSSAASDAMFWNKPTLEYCPDFEQYAKSDRGFVAPFEMYHAEKPVINPDEIQDVILERLRTVNSIRIGEIKAFLYGPGPFGYEPTMDNIMKII